MTKTAAFVVVKSSAAQQAGAPTVLGLLAVAASLSVVAVLGGCDQRSNEARTLHAAAETLNAVGVAPAVGTKKYEDKLKEVAAAAESVGSGGSDGEKASAALLSAKVLAGQGEVAANEAKNIELQIANRVTGIVARVGDYSRLAATAAALATFNPASDLAGLSASAAKRGQELAELKGKQDEAKNKLSVLEGQAAEKMTASEAAANQYATAMEAASGLTATGGAEAVKNANVLRREADNLRTQGGKLQAQIDMLKPVVHELGLLVDQATNQIGNHEGTAKSLRDKAEASRQDAAELMESATVTSNEVDKAIVELVDQRATVLSSAYAKAADLFKKSASKAAAGASAARAASKASAGSGEMSQAEVHWHKAQGANRFAQVLEAVARVEPALPGKSEYEKRATEAREEAKESLKAATDALDRAQSAFSGVSIGDAAAKARAAALGEQIAKLKLLAEGAAIAPPPAAAAAVQTANVTATAAAGVTAVDPELEAVVAQYLTALQNGTISTLMESHHIVSDKSKNMVKAQLAMSDSIMQADRACMEKFGEPMMKVLAAVPGFGQGLAMMGGGQEFAKLRESKATDIKIIPAGDLAMVSIPGVPAPLPFKKVDGKWVQDTSAMDAAAGLIPPAMRAMVEKLPALFGSWGADVAAGKFADKAAAVAAFQQALIPIQMEMMKSMQGGSGGGG